MTDQYFRALYNLMLDLSTELDLHYNDNEREGLQISLQHLSRAAEVLRSNGFTVPEAYHHVLLRFGSVSA